MILRMHFVSNRELAWSIPVGRTILATVVGASVRSVTGNVVPMPAIVAGSTIVGTVLWMTALLQALNGGQVAASAGMDLIAAYLGGSLLGMAVTTALLVQLCLISPYLQRLMHDFRELPLSTPMRTCVVGIVVFGPTILFVVVLTPVIGAFFVGMGRLPTGTFAAVLSGVVWCLAFWAVPTRTLLSVRRRAFREDLLTQSSGILFLIVAWLTYLLPLGVLLIDTQFINALRLPDWYPSNFWFTQQRELSTISELIIICVSLLALAVIAVVIGRRKPNTGQTERRSARTIRTTDRISAADLRRSPSSWLGHLGAKNFPWLTDLLLFPCLGVLCVFTATRMLGYGQDSGAWAMATVSAMISCIPISKVPGSMFPYIAFSKVGMRRGIWVTGMLRLAVCRASVLLAPAMVILASLSAMSLVWPYLVGALIGFSSAITVGIVLAPSASLPVGQIAMAVFLVGLAMGALMFHEHLDIVYLVGFGLVALFPIAVMRRDERDYVAH